MRKHANLYLSPGWTRGIASGLRLRERKNDMSERKLRNYMREKFGKRNYRMRKDGGIDAYGKIPNTNVTGWYFLGWRDDVVALIKIGQL